MADGVSTPQTRFIITLDEDGGRKLATLAEAAGVAPEQLAADIVVQTLEPAHDVTEAQARLAVYDRTGAFDDAEAALDRFVSEVERRAALRA